MSGNDAHVPIGWVREIIFDTTQPEALSRFWARLLGGTPTEWYDGWITLEPPPHGQRLSFQRTVTRSDHHGGVHFDVLVDDLEIAHGVVLESGGSCLGEHWSPRRGPAGESIPWRVYADPEGHRFCLVVR
ncbi:MAG: glyoxalase [Marmoricola sp.]|jgi:hypothetical protein|nr:glyoxalase [Marmoricola sp.]